MTGVHWLHTWHEVRPGNVAQALERDRWPVYIVEVGRIDLDAVRPLRPGMLIPGTMAVRSGTPPPPWEAVRELLEEP